MKKIWQLGLGFFAISITWSVYNAFVPFFLEDFALSTFWIAFIMTIDNYFALFIQPWVGRKSDRTETRFGRRMPFLLIGMPLAAVFTSLIPFYQALWMLLIFTIGMNLSMSLFRSPTVALMPDITMDAQRSRANGVINFMGGVGAIIAFAVGSSLYRENEAYPFYMVSVLMLLALLVLHRSIKEKRDTLYLVPAESPKITFREELNKPTIFLLLAVFFWFVSYQGVDTLFTLYGKHHIGMEEADASFSLTFFSLAFVMFAIPSGFLGTRFGKKRMIMIGVVGMIIVFGTLVFVETMMELRLLMLLGGMLWACININSYPFVVGMGEDRKIGTRTGLYYLVSSVAAIISPPLLGALVDRFNYSVLFIYATAGMVLALLMMANVKEKATDMDNSVNTLAN